MQKTLIVLIVGLLAVGCASTPTMKSVAGAYEASVNAIGALLLENGIAWTYLDGEKRGPSGQWKIIDGSIHVGDKNGAGVYRINKDGSLTAVGWLDKDGKRKDATKDEWFILKKKPLGYFTDQLE